MHSALYILLFVPCALAVVCTRILNKPVCAKSQTCQQFNETSSFEVQSDNKTVLFYAHDTDCDDATHIIINGALPDTTPNTCSRETDWSPWMPLPGNCTVKLSERQRFCDCGNCQPENFSRAEISSCNPTPPPLQSPLKPPTINGVIVAAVISVIAIVSLIVFLLFTNCNTANRFSRVIFRRSVSVSACGSGDSDRDGLVEAGPQFSIEDLNELDLEEDEDEDRGDRIFLCDSELQTDMDEVNQEVKVPKQNGKLLPPADDVSRTHL